MHDTQFCLPSGDTAPSGFCNENSIPDALQAQTEPNVLFSSSLSRLGTVLLAICTEPKHTQGTDLPAAYEAWPRLLQGRQPGARV